MLKMLFWNIAGKDLFPQVKELVHRHDVDFVLLAECHSPPANFLSSVNSPVPRYHYLASQYRRIVGFVRFAPVLAKIVHDGPNLLISKISLPGKVEFLLAAAHLPSRLREDPISLNMECEELADTIRNQEKHEGHERSIVIGDLNLNPFEPAVVGAPGFHAIMSRQIALKVSRKVHGRRYPYFYNPMWNYFGDEQIAAGTYYYRGGGHLTYFWNLFDQVLIRPDLIPYLPKRSVEVVTTTGTEDLMRENMLPNRSKFSDHLPILFTINL